MSQEKPNIPIGVVEPFPVKNNHEERKLDTLWLDLWYEEKWICVDAFDAKMRGRSNEFVIISRFCLY